MAKQSTDTGFVTWFSRIFRWVLGAVIIAAGIMFYEKDGWTAILFGALIFITGFLKPVRCNSDECTINQADHK